MKQKIVGIYEVGYEQIELILREGYGGEFYLIPEPKKNKLPQIKVGADEKKWKDIVATLIHEIDEYVCMRLQCRYQLSNDINHSHSTYFFHMTHDIFTEKCDRIAEFLVSALPDLEKAWKKF